MKKLSGNEFDGPRILFLGYGREETRLIDEIISAGYELWHTESEITDSDKFDVAVSYGYRHLISDSELRNKNCLFVNLHLSFLPYNRGAHPNFWSFFDQTPSGVTIHKIDSGIDTGDIICQRKIEFNPSEKTFAQTYRRLRVEMELLFLEWRKEIFSKNFIAVPQNQGAATYHRIADLPVEFSGWDAEISTEIIRLRKLLGK